MTSTLWNAVIVSYVPSFTLRPFALFCSPNKWMEKQPGRRKKDKLSGTNLPNFSGYPVLPCCMTWMKSCVRMKGTRSLLIPNLDLKFPRMWPKSMWKSWTEQNQWALWNQEAETGFKKEKRKKKSLSYLPGAADHDVVAVAVSNAQDVGGYTVACAWQSELLDGSIESVTVDTRFTQSTFRILFSASLAGHRRPEVLKMQFHQRAASYPEFLSLSQLSKASLLKAAAAAMLLLVSWMLAIVSADETTSISPARSPVARQPYGTILHDM